jgi:uncharacterized membrane protein
MKFLVSTLIFVSIWTFVHTPMAKAEEPLAIPSQSDYKSEFFTAQVIQVTNEGAKDSPDGRALSQDIKIRLASGPDKGKELEILGYFSSLEGKRLAVGEQVVINHVTTSASNEYYVADKYRTPPTILIALIFFICVLIFARLKGFFSIIGLFFSLMVLFGFVVPQILSGHNPLLISMVGALLIAFFSLYLAHGFNKQTSIALFATLLSLGLSFGLTLLFVGLAKLTGAGSEESFYLQSGAAGSIDLRGLLLGGIIIGALGVLDDITTGQTAAVNQIHHANPTLGFTELYRRGLAVGHEHIASLVNTLVLAYVGASFPLLLLFSVNASIQPLWVTINSEFVTEEIVRTLVGSTTLVFAVPIATALAAWFLHKQPVSVGSPPHSHVH